jgi:hypothetical protein
MKEVVVPPELPLADANDPPVQNPLILFGDAIVSPVGRVSVKATPVNVPVVSLTVVLQGCEHGLGAVLIAGLCTGVEADRPT